jgi:hypothetical protein
MVAAVTTMIANIEGFWQDLPEEEEPPRRMPSEGDIVILLGGPSNTKAIGSQPGSGNTTQHYRQAAARYLRSREPSRRVSPGCSRAASPAPSHPRIYYTNAQFFFYSWTYLIIQSSLVAVCQALISAWSVASIAL